MYKAFQRLDIIPVDYERDDSDVLSLFQAIYDSSDFRSKSKYDLLKINIMCD